MDKTLEELQQIYSEAFDESEYQATLYGENSIGYQRAEENRIDALYNLNLYEETQKHRNKNRNIASKPRGYIINLKKAWHIKLSLFNIPYFLYNLNKKGEKIWKSY